MAAKPDPDPIEERLDEIARLLALTLKRERPLSDVIVELHEVGLRPARIADLVGTTTTYAHTAITRSKKKPSKSPK